MISMRSRLDTSARGAIAALSRTMNTLSAPRAIWSLTSHMPPPSRLRVRQEPACPRRAQLSVAVPPAPMSPSATSSEALDIREAIRSRSAAQTAAQANVPHATACPAPPSFGGARPRRFDPAVSLAGARLPRTR
jgi:hypothetical protein